MIAGLARFLYELAHELWHERQRAQKIRRAREAWATKPGPRRTCSNCREIAYLPDQLECFKCGAIL